MLQVFVRFYAGLNDLLPAHRRHVEFVRRLNERASVKDVIESLGVPHPEVDLILVNGESVGFDYLVADCDRISVYPPFRNVSVAAISNVRPTPLNPIRFVLDVHLGKLATYLRLLGFDALYRNDYADDELAQISSQEQRMLLTQDRGLLKRSVVIYGYLVRSHDPEEQVREVLQRFDLHGEVAPFERCPRCNGSIEPVDAAEVANRLPMLTQQYYSDFSKCQDCSQVYWKGAHYERIQRLINQLVQ